MKKFLSVFFMLFVLFIVCFPSVAFSGETVLPPRPEVCLPDIATMIESRYAHDEKFKSFVELMLMVGAGNLLLATLLTAIMGLRQVVLWSFVGGYLFMGIIEFFLILYFRFGSVAYGCFFAFCFALACAFFIYWKNARNSGYGHARFHK